MDAANCPVCNSVMALRTARKGRNPGNQFWGCSRYPACRGTVRADEGGVARRSHHSFVPQYRRQMRKGPASRLSSERSSLAEVAFEFGPVLVGCGIKGNISINSGERIYHLPGQKFYFATRINLLRGEKWFCSELAARAGWMAQVARLAHTPSLFEGKTIPTIRFDAKKGLYTVHE